MQTHLSHLFNIRTYEWPRVLLLFFMAFIQVTAVTWGKLSAQPLFWQQIGVDRLGSAFVIEAIIALLAVTLYTPFADRIANDKLLVGIVFLSAVSVAVGQVAIWLNLESAAAYILYPLFQVIKVTFNLQWWTYVISLYDTRASKRIVPFLASNARVSGGLAGLSVTYLVDWLGSRHIFTASIAAFLVLVVLLWFMPRILSEQAAPKRDSDDEDGFDFRVFVKNTREGYNYVARSAYLRWLALSTILAMVLITLLKYESSLIIDTSFSDPDSALKFLGQLEGIANLVLLPVQMFLLARVIGRVGLGNANLIYASTMMGISLLLFGPFVLFAGALAYLGTDVLDATFRRSPFNLLYNAVPLRVKGRSRAFVNGFLMPVASLIGGVILLIPAVLNNRWLLSGIVTAVAIAYVLVMIVVRQAYSHALIKMLEQEDYAFLLANEGESLQIVDDMTLRQLSQRLQSSPNDDFTIFMAHLLSEVGGEAAVPILAEVAANYEGDVRATILDILMASDVQTRAAYDLYYHYLDDDVAEVRCAAVIGILTVVDDNDAEFLLRAHSLLNDPDLEVRAGVMPALFNSHDTVYVAAATKTLQAMLSSEVAVERQVGATVVGGIKDGKLLTDLLPLLSDSEDEVRLEAVLSLEILVSQEIPLQLSVPFRDYLMPLLRDPIERVREATVRVLGQLPQADIPQQLIGLLDDDSRLIREVVGDTLVKIGPSVIPALLQSLETNSIRQRNMCYVILSRIDVQQFEVHLLAAIEQNIRDIYQWRMQIELLRPLTYYAGIDLLRLTLRGLVGERLDEIFYLLTGLHDRAEVDVIEDSLQSESPHIRASAIEAFEIVTTAPMANLIGVLYEPETTLADLTSVAKDRWGLTVVSLRDVLIGFEEHDDAWLRMVMVYSYGEIMNAINPIEKVQKRRRRPDVVTALVDDMGNGARKTAVFPLVAAEMERTLERATMDTDHEVQQAALLSIAQRQSDRSERFMLSPIEKIIFLREVPFFQEMRIPQLKALAEVCEERFYEEDETIFEFGDPGGALYIITRGRVGLDRPGLREGASVRLATASAHDHFGEMTLLDGGPRSATAVALQDTLVLRLRREPLLVLIRQNPDMSLRLINVLSQHLRETSAKLASMSRSHSRRLQKVYDKLE